MVEQTKIEKLNEELAPILNKALKMGVVLTVISVDVKPAPGQMCTAGGVSTLLQSNDLIEMLEDTLTNLKANQ